MTRLTSFLRMIAVSRIAVFGAAFATAGFLAEIILLVGEVLFFESHPYIGLVSYVLIPGMIVLGLLLIPVGIVWRLRRAGAGMSLSAIDRLARDRRVGVGQVSQLITVLSLVNLVIFGVVGYRGFHYTESTAFCGELCHSVMHPEYETYGRSPHSEVACIECHIGAGAGPFIKAKLSGVRQLIGVLTDDYARPIPTPVHNLRPASEICATCHRSEIQYGNQLSVREHFESDEANTRSYTVLNMRVGGGDAPGQPAHGIHWHAGESHEVRFLATDDDREHVVWVEQRNADGTSRVWTNPDDPVARPPDEQLRLMDCIDCHNRPAHVYLPPDEALDSWLGSGRIDPTIPWIRKVAYAVMTEPYESVEAAMAGIGRLPDRYREAYPDKWSEVQERVQATVAPLQQLHAENVFPDMKIAWNTYPSKIGHATPHTQACFRCHNGVLRDEANIPITLDCASCHYVLANREVNPRILDRLVP